MKLIDKVLKILDTPEILQEEAKENIISLMCPNALGFKDISDCGDGCSCNKCWNREVKEMKSFSEFCHDEDCSNCKLNEYTYMDKGTCRELYAEALRNGGRVIIDLNEYEECEE